MGNSREDVNEWQLLQQPWCFRPGVHHQHEKDRKATCSTLNGGHDATSSSAEETHQGQEEDQGDCRDQERCREGKGQEEWREKEEDGAIDSFAILVVTMLRLLN